MVSCSSPGWPVSVRNRRRRATWRRWFRPIAELPPLVLGVGVLAVPWLAALASRFLLDRGQIAPRCSVGDLAAAIDTREHPWILMACAVGLVLLPRFFRNSSGPLALRAAKHAA